MADGAARLQPAERGINGSRAAQSLEVFWREHPTPSVALNTATNLGINRLCVASHDSFDGKKALNYRQKQDRIQSQSRSAIEQVQVVAEVVERKGAYFDVEHFQQVVGCGVGDLVRRLFEAHGVEPFGVVVVDHIVFQTASAAGSHTPNRSWCRGHDLSGWKLAPSGGSKQGQLLSTTPLGSFAGDLGEIDQAMG